MSNPLGLRPASSGEVACKVCNNASRLFGVVDVNRPCQTEGAHQGPLLGVPVYYRRCGSCGFLFTDAFDDWSMAQFGEHIYNSDYKLYDPEYATIRPTNSAKVVINHWGKHKDKIRVLDYGGGNDVFCSELRAYGFKEAITYDPMVPEHSVLPEGKFDLVTCFETLEHVPDPAATIAEIAGFVAEPGAVFYSTLTQPADFERQGVAWWYVGPRNGHISIFTKKALALSWQRHGFLTTSFNEGMHMSFRNLPPEWGFGG